LVPESESESPNILDKLKSDIKYEI
jgi:hypothetical protein